MPRSLSSPNSELDELTPSVRWTLLERVAASAQLKRASRLRDFLLYVGKQSIRAGVADLHEQQIGSAVFGRPEYYDTSQDNIVRVNATELRKRIELYFATEGIDEPVVFEIPRGSYTPVFYHRKQESAALQAEPQPATASQEAAVHTPASLLTAQEIDPLPGFEVLPGSADIAAAQPAASARRNSLWLMFVCAVLAILALGLGWHAHQLETRLHPWKSQPALREFWGNFLGPEHKTDLVLADTAFALTQDITGQQLSLNDYLDYHYQQAGPVSPISENELKEQRKDLHLILDRNNGSIGDFRVAQRIAGLDEASSSVQLRFARDYSANALRHNSSILMGSRRSNPWVDLFDDQLNYKIVFSTERQQSLVKISDPQNGELPEYAASPDPATKTGYCVIAFLPNLSREADTLIIAGTDSQATEAAGEFLTNNAAMSKLLERMNRSSFPHFQLLLKTARFNGTPLGSEIVSFRVDPR